MLKILTTQQIKELDAHTIRHEPVASIDLMERACRAFVTWFTQHADATKKIAIVCGTGNNGGDGLGIARMLKDWGYNVKVLIVRGLVPESEDFKINLSRIKGKIDIVDIIATPANDLFANRDVIIDGIFGSGLSRPAEGLYAETIEVINQTHALRIAIDIPSGLMADKPSSGSIVKADYTIAFQLPKLAFLLPESFQFTGEWIIVDIGLDKDHIRQTETPYSYVTAKAIRKILKKRSKFDHKGTFGHALIVAGSFGKIGAAVLASRAALRAGTGLLTVHIPKCGYDIMQTSVPEAMTDVDAHDNYFSGFADTDKYSTIGVGPGLGQDVNTVKALEGILTKFRKPVVLDADALNILAAHRGLMRLIPEASILTPHPKEFERLAGGWKNDFERLEKQKKLSRDLRCIVILKGAYSSIAMPDGNMFFNSTGNPGMATGGTGDVLTGILTGLLAQSYTPAETALLGVFLHGLCGDLAAQERGMNGLIASDLVEFIPPAYRTLSRA